MKADIKFETIFSSSAGYSKITFRLPYCINPERLPKEMLMRLRTHFAISSTTLRKVSYIVLGRIHVSLKLGLTTFH
jgi:hypothetical protein